MKKAFIMFAVFFVLDIVFLIWFLLTDAMIYFLPAIFLEVAIFGSVIVWDIAELKDKHNDDDENNRK